MDTDTTSAPARRLRNACLVSSLLVTALGLAWWFGDTLWYFDRDGDRGDSSLLSLLPQRLDAALFACFGLAGSFASFSARPRLVLAVAVPQAVAFAGLGGDIGVLMILGYVIALTFPVALVGSLVWGASRSRAAAAGLTVLVLVAGSALAASGRVDLHSLQELGEGLASAVRTNVLPHLVVAGFVAHGLLWAALGVRAARERRGACVSCGRDDLTGSDPRWRVPVTLLAVACALPYGLLRLTWLTGAPWGMTDAELDAEPGIRVMGLLLGLAGIAGAVLTLGLLQRWGRVFPTWIPFVGGRKVPILFPTLTAGTVGAVMAVAGRSMLQSFLLDLDAGGSPNPTYLIVIPLPVWGPALMLAAWGYYLKHRGPCPQCSPDEPVSADLTACAAAADLVSERAPAEGSWR